GQIQCVISLGTTRILKVGKKNYQMGNGDIIFFGSSSHGVLKEPGITTGRISIATFCVDSPTLGHMFISLCDDQSEEKNQKEDEKESRREVVFPDEGKDDNKLEKGLEGSKTGAFEIKK